MAREAMLEPGQDVWVAVSGGVDSMVLLHVLRQLGHPCHVAHVDHGLRGAGSDADRAFVEAYAKEQGLPFKATKVDIRNAAAGGSVQMAAREMRYAWFKELLQAGPHAIALGHHGDDAVETLLINLLRGVGTHGWAGMPAVTQVPEGRFVRPLLGLDRAQVGAYAAEHGIPFREDPSNADPKYLRNRVRRELLPLMEELRPGAAHTLARATRLMREMTEVAALYLGNEARQWTDTAGTLRIPLGRLLEGPAPHLLLLHVLAGQQAHPALVGQVLERVADRATGARFHVGDLRLTVERDCLVVDHGPVGFPSITIPEDGVADGTEAPFQWQLVAPEEVDLGRGMGTVWLDMDKLRFPLLLRPWMPGDRMRPVGLKGSKLISDILIDAGAPRDKKEGTYVLVAGDEVVWLEGHRVAEGFSPGPETRQVLRIGPAER